MNIRIPNLGILVPRILALALPALLLAAPALADEGKITILSPHDGEEVSAGKPLIVSFEAVWGPNGNHLHLYLDNHRLDVIRVPKGSEDIGQYVMAGKHVICLEIETSWHISTGVKQCVTVTAK